MFVDDDEEEEDEDDEEYEEPARRGRKPVFVDDEEDDEDEDEYEEPARRGRRASFDDDDEDDDEPASRSRRRRASDDFDDEFDDYETYEEEDEDDDEPGFGQNVLSFIKGVIVVILVVAVLIFGLRVLDEKEIVSCAWFREHLGSVGTMLFGEAPQSENIQ